MDRPDIANYAGQFTYNFDYTATGMTDLITEQRNSVTTWTSDYVYDHQDRATSVTTPNGTVSYAYDGNGNRASMTTPSGTTTYQYTGNDQLRQVNAPMGQTNLTYNNVGLPDTLTYPNGVIKDYGYDDRDRLTSLTYQDGMNTLASYNYTLDTVGNRTRVDELGGDYTTWGYDHQYRLTSETIHDGGNTRSSSYSYDAVGNRTSQTVNGTTTTYAYNALDQMTSAGNVTYGYNGRGNLTTVTDGSDITTYSYDALDRLTTAQVPGSSSAAYTYDPNGQRVRQTVGSDTTNYLWDELSAYGDVVRETNGSGTELANYTLAGSQLIAQTRSNTTSYYLSDGQGSTRALLNGTGDITDTYAYTAFGEVYNQTGSTLNNYRYTGQQFDSLTGLYSLRARYYDPGVGRFVSRDTYPINYRNPIELNRYGYVGNNPINGYDPSGFGLVAYGEINLKALGARVLIGAFSGMITAGIGVFITYMMASSGACGEESKEWADHVDPMQFLWTAVGGGGLLGGIFAIHPAIAAIGATDASIAFRAGDTVPQVGMERQPLSSCFFVDTIKSVTDQLFDPKKGLLPGGFTIAAGLTQALPGAPAVGGAVAEGAGVAAPTIGVGASVTGANVALSFSAIASGVAAGLIALVAAGAYAYKCDVDNDPSCVPWEWDIRGLLRDRHIPQPAGKALNQARIVEVRAYMQKYNNFHRPLGKIATGHIAILQAKGQWFIGFNQDIEDSATTNVYVKWDKKRPANSQKTIDGSNALGGLKYPGYISSHAESNALQELWASGGAGGGDGIMVIDGFPCGTDCYKSEVSKDGQIKDGATANQLSLKVKYPGGSFTVP